MDRKTKKKLQRLTVAAIREAKDELRKDEKERFKRTFADELLEYHFERRLGENQDNEKQWCVLLDDHIEPHTEILCDFSNWLIARGWSKETVEELFFIAVDRPAPVKPIASPKRGKLRSFLDWIKP